MSIYKQERAGEINGVSGRFFSVTTGGNRYKPGTFTSQKWSSVRRAVGSKYGKGAHMWVEIRFDDECRNGHNTFAVGASVIDTLGRDIAGGCLHEDIAHYFPQLKPLLKWHLTSSDGPMHYIANTVYLAGDRDYNGLRLGEKRQLRNGRTGLPSWRLVAIDKDGEEIEIRKIDQHPNSEDVPPCPYTLEYRPWWVMGEGKERQLDLARSSAVWPEATDEELCVEPEVLRKALEARHAKLTADFRADMEAAGFLWEPVLL